MSSPPGRKVVYDYHPSSGRNYRDLDTTSREGSKLVAVRPRSPPRRGRDDDYYTKPRLRTNSLDPSEASSRRPLTIVGPRSPAKTTRPVITKESARPASPQSKRGGAQLEASYIMPASGRHHHRHSSVTTGDRLSTRERDRDRDRERERVYPGGQASTSLRRASRYANDERNYAYEYTTPKEQVLRDLAPPSRRLRSSSHSGGRPVSMIDLDDRDKTYLKSDREALPSTSNRGFESTTRKSGSKQDTRHVDDDLNVQDQARRRYLRDERQYPRYRDAPRAQADSRDDYIAYPPEQIRRSRQRQPTIEIEPPPRHPSLAEDPDLRDSDRLHKHHRHREAEERRVSDARLDRAHRREDDEGEILARRQNAEERDGRDPRREPDERHEKFPRRDAEDNNEQERRRRHRDKYDRERERGHEARERERDRHDDDGHGHTAMSVAAAGGTAAAAGLATEGVRRHRQRDEDERPAKPAPAHGREGDRQPNAPDTDLSEGEEREQRRRRRRREREIEDLSSRYETEERAPLRIEAAPSSEHALREQQSYERRPDDGHEPQGRRRKHRTRHRSPSGSTDNRKGQSDSSASDDSVEPVARTPRVVSPPNDGFEVAPRPPPRGILKKPREKFPEEEQPVREGVAPLDAAKKGIPPEARWTRVNRRLVNPEALEQEGVRFEEFPDYVIVLKVLSQEEIAKYTKVTHEIREKRRLEHGSQGSGSGSGNGGHGEDLPTAPTN